MEVKTFKEVHQEIENEHLFLQQQHDIASFREKASFLKGVGFANSIATKLYGSISDNYELIKTYGAKYQHKFLLDAQLERVCEKYNLYVRDPEFFLGDIPESNIRDIMAFSVYLKDVEVFYGQGQGVLVDSKTEYAYKKRFMEDNMHLLKHERVLLGPDTGLFAKQGVDNCVVPINVITRSRAFGHPIQIAAVKPLFIDTAFEKSQARIISYEELAPKNQVELDPIVLCKVKKGWIVITAWGDEANDELIINPKLN